MPRKQKSQLRKREIVATVAQAYDGRGPKYLPSPHHDGLRIQNCEYIGVAVARGESLSLVGAVMGNTTPVGHFINPTNSGLFPWLSNVAVNFDRWRGNFRFIFRTSTPTTQAGSVYLSIAHDPNDAIPATIANMMAHPITTSNAVYRGSSIKIDSKKWLLCSNDMDASRAAGSASLYSPGILELASRINGLGLNDEFIMGDLLVEYVVDLKQPTEVITVGAGDQQNVSRYRMDLVSSAAPTGTTGAVALAQDNGEFKIVDDAGVASLYNVVNDTMHNYIVSMFQSGNWSGADGAGVLPNVVLPGLKTYIRTLSNASAYYDVGNGETTGAYTIEVHPNFAAALADSQNATTHFSVDRAYNTDPGITGLPTMDVEIMNFVPNGMRGANVAAYSSLPKAAKIPGVGWLEAHNSTDVARVHTSVLRMARHAVVVILTDGEQVTHLWLCDPKRTSPLALPLER